MRTGRRPWPSPLSGAELIRGWIFFALYLFFFPWLMGWVQRFYEGELPVAEANVAYYLLLAALTFAAFWSSLRRGFSEIFDHPKESYCHIFGGLLWAAVIAFVVRLIPLPVQNPTSFNYLEQFIFSPGATALLLVVLMPLVEEPLFRGVLFGTARLYSRGLAYVLSTAGYSLYCASQFVYAYGTLDLRYLLLAIQYAPLALALTRCYEQDRSIWSAIALHGLFNGCALLFALRGWW